VSQDHRSGGGDGGLERFITSAFRSVWSLELLCLVRSRRDHDWSREELIASLRASEQVLARSIEDLVAADLIRAEENRIRYAPGSPALDTTVDEVSRLYASRPAFVRRLILGGGEDQLTRFADAFRLRGDNR
jgi:hypothetical protein